MFMIAILLPVPLYYRVDSLGLLVPMACLTPYFAPPPHTLAPRFVTNMAVILHC